jgi:hypothetical protein
MTGKLLDDCFLHDKDRLTHAEALEILTSRLGPVVGVEAVPLAEAPGRILAETVVAPRNIPAHTNAACASPAGPPPVTPSRAASRRAKRCASSPAR